MKIIHICLVGTYTEGYSYQENLLAKYHKLLGYDVGIIASKFVLVKDRFEIDNRDEYINKEGIKIIRLSIKHKATIKSKFKRFYGLLDALVKEKPNIIFIHGCQFLDIFDVIKFVKNEGNINVFVDNHSDFSNSATNWWSKTILHGIIWKKCANSIKPYTDKFYGVLPSRVDFLLDIYRLPKKKVELLVMGADDENVAMVNNEKIKQETRKKYNISNDDFLIVTGGKIDQTKIQTLCLIKAVCNINIKSVKLIVFGSIHDELIEEFNKFMDGEKVKYIGWLDDIDSYKIFSSSDLVVFPGRHSVYWEIVVGLRIPLIVKYWQGITHVDIGGNCKFLYNDSIDEIKENLIALLNNSEEYDIMKKSAETDAAKRFLYMRIAQDSIGID